MLQRAITRGNIGKSLGHFCAILHVIIHDQLSGRKLTFATPHQTAAWPKTRQSLRIMSLTGYLRSYHGSPYQLSKTQKP
jgi:hypothetical protein